MPPEGLPVGAALPGSGPDPGLGRRVPTVPGAVASGSLSPVGSSSRCAVVSVIFWNTADNIETFSGGKADIYVAPTPHTLTKDERAALVLVAQRFVESAVTRDHPERAYAIAGRSLRAGLTKKQWATGEIPVVPYPVESARWKVEYSHSEGVGLLVMVDPTEGVGAQAHRVRDEHGAGQGWWRERLARGELGCRRAAAPPRSERRARRRGRRSGCSRGARADLAQGERAVADRAGRSRLLVFVVPIAFFVRERRVSRRMRRYLDSRPLGQAGPDPVDRDRSGHAGHHVECRL